MHFYVIIKKCFECPRNFLYGFCEGRDVGYIEFRVLTFINFPSVTYPYHHFAGKLP